MTATTIDAFETQAAQQRPALSATEARFLRPLLRSPYEQWVSPIEQPSMPAYARALVFGWVEKQGSGLAREWRLTLKGRANVEED